MHRRPFPSGRRIIPLERSLGKVQLTRINGDGLMRLGRSSPCVTDDIAGEVLEGKPERL